MRDQAGPLPAQPYILVLWATHIGRYAIKHSPSENARASEPSRAIVKVLGTLCERSPLPPYPAADCTGTALLAALLSSPFSHTLSLSSSSLLFSFLLALLSLFFPSRSSPCRSPLRACGAASRFSHPADPKPITNVRGNIGRDKEKRTRGPTSKTETVAPVEIAARPPIPDSPFSERLASSATTEGRWRSRRRKRDRTQKENDDARLLGCCCCLVSNLPAVVHRQTGTTRIEIARLLFRPFDTEQDDVGPRRCAGMKTTDSRRENYASP